MLTLGISQLWGWIGLGLALIAIEVLVAPGSYLLWLGLAALITGFIVALTPLGAVVELVVFGVLSVLSGLIGWKVYALRSAGPDAADGLHELGPELVGREVTLASAIIEGHGQARIADSVWRVSGPDLPEGTKVRITALDGAVLKVEAA